MASLRLPENLWSTAVPIGLSVIAILVEVDPTDAFSHLGAWAPYVLSCAALALSLTLFKSLRSTHTGAHRIVVALAFVIALGGLLWVLVSSVRDRTDTHIDAEPTKTGKDTILTPTGGIDDGSTNQSAAPKPPKTTEGPREVHAVAPKQPAKPTESENIGQEPATASGPVSARQEAVTLHVDVSSDAGPLTRAEVDVRWQDGIRNLFTDARGTVSHEFSTAPSSLRVKVSASGFETQERDLGRLFESRRETFCLGRVREDPSRPPMPAPPAVGFAALRLEVASHRDHLAKICRSREGDADYFQANAQAIVTEEYRRVQDASPLTLPTEVTVYYRELDRLLRGDNESFAMRQRLAHACAQVHDRVPVIVAQWEKASRVIQNEQK